MEWGKNLDQITGFYIEAEKLKIIQDLMFSGFHVLLTGNPGCGKTAFGQSWAKSFAMRAHIVNCGAIRSPRDWFGRWEYREGIGTVFIPSKFIEMIEEPALIILDEINRTTPENHNSIMNILDGNREVYVDELNRQVKVHEQTIFIATANNGRQHSGIYPLDAALEDRFQVIKLNLPPQDAIVQLLNERYSISLREMEAIVNITTKLDELYDEDVLSKTMGLRPALAACALIAKGNPLATALKYAFVYHYPSNDIEHEQTIVAQTIQGLVSDVAFI